MWQYVIGLLYVAWALTALAHEAESKTLVVFRLSCQLPYHLITLSLQRFKLCQQRKRSKANIDI